jgi:formate dehydrogenase
MSESTPTLQQYRHPGASKRKTRKTNRGRQIDQAAAREISDLLGDRARRRDLLIEHLHLIQDRYRHISSAHLAALAGEMGLPMAEVFEVATFYAHFDVVGPGELPPPLTVRVCDSLSCEMAGAQALLAGLPELVGAGVRVVRAPCMGRCDCAPVVEVGHRHVDGANTDAVVAVVRGGDHDPEIPPYIDFDGYVADGGYGLLRDCLDGRRPVEEIIAVMESSGLRGLGGAGFPAGQKWRLVRQETGPRLMAVNADEGEPGTFKDRHYMESDPHRCLEGMLIAAWAVEASDVYFYLRDEYPGLRHVLLGEIAKIEAEGLDRASRIHLRRGAGAYICGEEGAMMESIEGKRGLPRNRPPYPTQAGLFGRPTLIHNVETIYWVRDLVERGAEWFSGQGRNGRRGRLSFSVSGRVAEPGVKLAPAGITVVELIDEFCGGMAEGHVFKGYLPGGASGGILPASKGDIPLDFDTLQVEDCFIGSAAIVVLSEADNARDVALNLLRFFADESCGQCTPCRVGCEKAVMLMDRPEWDGDLLREISGTMMDASICGLGQAAPNPMLMVLKHFPEDI